MPPTTTRPVWAKTPAWNLLRLPKGDYIVEAGNVEEVTGPDCYYRLDASLVQPDFKIAIETDRLAVPRGGTIELPVTLERLGGYAGPVTVRVENLPPGVRSQGGIVPAGKNNVDHHPDNCARCALCRFWHSPGGRSRYQRQDPRSRRACMGTVRASFH